MSTAQKHNRLKIERNRPRPNSQYLAILYIVHTTLASQVFLFTTKIYLCVATVVRIITPASDITVNDETLEINVYVIGVSQPSITWSKDGEVLNDNPRFTIIGSNLSLPNAQYADAGVYKMTAQNIADTAQRSYYVIIRCKLQLLTILKCIVVCICFVL